MQSHCFLLLFFSIIIAITQHLLILQDGVSSMYMISKCVTSTNATCISVITDLIITIRIFSDLIGASTALFFSAGLKLDSEIQQLHQPIILSALSLIHQSHNLSP